MSKIVSDFVDFYDDWFADNTVGNKELIFKRFSKPFMTRSEAFKTLNSIGVEVVRHGACKYMQDNGGKVVVYTDIYGHGGEGKVLLDITLAKQSMPNYLCSEYIDSVRYSGLSGIENIKSVSVRHIQLGEYWFRFQVTSDDWRSNVGNGSYKLIDLGFTTDKFSDYPVYSIDYVVGENGLIATDFNRNIKVGFTGDILRYVSSAEIARSIGKIIERKKVENGRKAVSEQQ